VVAGIRNTAAIVLITGQFWAFFGVPRRSWGELLGDLGIVQPLTFIVAAATALVVWKGHRLMHKAIVPPVALLLGTGLYYVFQLTVPGARLGPLLGALPSAVPTPAYAAGFAQVFGSGEYLSYLPILLSGALAIAVLDSVSALITLVAFQSVAGQRFDTNRQLVGQGIGTAAVSVFGGLSTSAIFARGAVNYGAGGRTRLSGVANSATVLLLILLLAKPLGFLPKAALAGLIMVIAVGLLDRWSLGLLREALNPRAERRPDLYTDVALMLAVVAVGVGVNLIWAVATGVVVSILIFVVQMSRSPIRRIRTGHAVRSKVRRDVDRTKILAEHAHRIAVVELEGTVFFASSDSVARKLEELAAGGVDYLILDMKRVRRIDATGFRVIGQTYERLAATGVMFGFSYVSPQGDRPDLAWSLTLTGGVSGDHCFATTDAALEACEEDLLARLETEGPDVVEWSLDRFARSLELNPEEQRILSAMLRNRSYAPGEAVCRIGAPGDSMFLVSRGSADVSIPIPESGRSRRLSTVTAGTIIGEMALLDGETRSADIVAKDHLFCFELTATSFAELQREHPEIAGKIYTALVRILGSRLREANALISELDV